jgi:hypothetical protein
LVAALRRVSASALVVNGRVGTTDHFALAINVAAEIFPIRFVCGFGHGASDGIIPLDDLYSAEKTDPLPSLEAERAGEPGPGAHLAVITWDLTADGLVPVARNHAELIAGGLGVLLESRMPQDAAILSTIAMSSFAGLAVTLMPWLLLGGTLALHHAFDSDAFIDQQKAVGPDTLIVPGPLLDPLAEGGYLSSRGDLRSAVGVWRSPERLVGAPAWRDPKIRVVDAQVFGEAAIIATCRGPSGKPTAMSIGRLLAPRGPNGAVLVADIASTPAGTLALRGPMVPRVAFPPGAERTGHANFKMAADGFVDTGSKCHVEHGAMVVTGSPPGLVGIGGYRFVERDLQGLVGRAEDGIATFVVVPDALTGHRLGGTASDRGAIRDALAKRGANPLLIAAFRDHPRPAA